MVNPMTTREPSTAPPITAVPRRFASARVRRLRTWGLFGCLLAAAAMGLAAFAQVGTIPPPYAPPPAVEHGAFAVRAADDWLAGRPSTVPAVEGVDVELVDAREPMDGYDGEVTWASGEVVDVVDRPAERHALLARAGDRLIEVTVLVLAGSEGPVLAALPTIAPVPAGGETEAVIYESDLEVGLDIEVVQDRATEWAAAYLGDDAPALYLLTGDDSGRSYRGVGGFAVADVQVLSLTTDGTRVVAQVNVRYRPAGDPADTDRVYAGDWELLLGNTESGGVPTVQAWGPAGSGYRLDAFSNADTGGPVNADDTVDDDTATTTTDAPATTPPTSPPTTGIGDLMTPEERRAWERYVRQSEGR